MRSVSEILLLACAMFCFGCATSDHREAENYPFTNSNGEIVALTAEQSKGLRLALESEARSERLAREMNNNPRLRQEALAFTRRVADVLREELADPAIELSVQEPLQIKDSSWSSVLVEDDFVKCREDRAACPAVIARFVKNYAPILRRQNVALMRLKVRLSVRDEEYVAHLQESLGKEGPELQVEPLLGGLLLLAELDRQPVPTPLDARDLGRLFLSHDQLFSLGRSNLQEKLGPMPASVRPVAQDQIGEINGGEYESSRLLLHSQWQALADGQNGILIIALPTNNTVLYISQSTPAAISSLRQTASRKASNEQAAKVLRWNRTGWETVN